MKQLIQYFLLITLIFSVMSCDKNDGVDSSALDELKTNAVNTYAVIVFASYEDSYTAALSLQSAIQTFVQNPTDANFSGAKQAWLDAREPYGQTEAYRFSNGPIDDEDGPEPFLNAWPLDENYIDYVDGNATSGIINNLADFPTISTEVLEAQNELGGEANISVGYHAIEFLLWGQDLTAPENNLPGQRPFTDYLNSPNGTAQNQDRRGEYLLACADLLVSHLKSVKDEWDPTIAGNYREEFLALSANEALTKILTGIGVLSRSELSGERIFTAYDNQDQEDEHSCFSDNTHRDIRLNAKGIANVYNGSYTRINGNLVAGPALDDLMEEVNAELAANVRTVLADAIDKVEATATPFDIAISNQTYRPAIVDAVNALRDTGDKFAEVGAALGVTINTSLP